MPSKRLGLTFEARRKRNIKDSAHSTSPCISLYLTDNVGNCFSTCLTASSNLSRRCWRSLSAFWSWPLRKRSRKVTNKEEFWAQACDVTMHYSGTQRRRWLIIQLTAHYSFLRGKKHANHHKVSLQPKRRMNPLAFSLFIHLQFRNSISVTTPPCCFVTQSLLST